MRRLTVNRVLLLSALAVTPTGAQQRTVTRADYDRAARMLAQNLNGLVVGGSVSPNWVPGDRFWYRNVTADGMQIVRLDDPNRTVWFGANGREPGSRHPVAT